MADPNYFNDAPIVEPDEDQFGIDPFAQALARSIRDIKAPVGTTIALNGPWGSGKSSAINLIRHHLKQSLKDGALEIIDFKCWWFRGEEALTLAFLQELNATLRKNLGAKAKELIPKIGKTLLQAGPVVGAAVNLATSGVGGEAVASSLDFSTRFFAEGETVEKLFRQLSTALAEQNKRFLVVIDDIDRLTPDEALLVFRLVKSVGQLPNVVYLLAFDGELAERAVKERYPSEGPHFLEKIIQAAFELPLPARDDLNLAALTQILAICGQLEDKNRQRRFLNIFYDAVSPYLATPRDVVRISNAMAISWPAVAGEVDVADYAALEVMRLFERPLYNAIRVNKSRVCGVRSQYGKSEYPREEIQSFLEIVPEKRQESTRTALMRLFPRFEKVVYSNDFVREWEAQRLVCVDKHFDTYFRMAIGPETLSIEEIDGFIRQCGDETFVKEAFLEALGSIRRSGKSKVPLLFDELNTHAPKIEKSTFIPLIAAVFEIADEIDREEDQERGFSIGDNYLRIHWLIRRLTFERCDLHERSKILMAACRHASLGWLLDFTHSAIRDYFPEEDEEPQPPERCLVKKECLPELKASAIKAIENSAKSGSLLSNRRLAVNLHLWQDLAKDKGAAVKAWTAKQLTEDIPTAYLAKAFTVESWSQGMGMLGLGDRVAMPSARASVDGLDSILDVDVFRQRLEKLEADGTLDSPHKENVGTFLEAWRKRDKKP